MVPRRTLSGILGGCREIALIEAFALRPNKSLSATDLERMSGVSWATVHRRLGDWENLGLVYPADKDGKAVLYRLNEASPAVKALAKGIRLALAELAQAELRDEGIDERLLVHPHAKRLAVVKVASSEEDPAFQAPPTLPVTMQRQQKPHY